MRSPYAEVIGDPVSQSKSPLIHNYWLSVLRIRAQYRARHVRPHELEQFLRSSRADRDWLGCNVTIPHKEAASRLVDHCSNEAVSIGAINCIVPRSEGLVGFNTDIDGVAAALEGVQLAGRAVAILGAGGAARAALAYLVRQKVAAIHVLVRDPGAVQGFDKIAPPGTLTVGALSEAPRLLAGASAIINATPMGMTGCVQMPESLLAAVSRHQQALLFDMVYEPITTQFLCAGGARRIDGLAMLVGQARRAFELFFGTAPPPTDDELRDQLAG